MNTILIIGLLWRFVPLFAIGYLMLKQASRRSSACFVAMLAVGARVSGA